MATNEFNWSPPDGKQVRDDLEESPVEDIVSDDDAVDEQIEAFYALHLSSIQSRSRIEPQQDEEDYYEDSDYGDSFENDDDDDIALVSALNATTRHKIAEFVTSTLKEVRDSPTKMRPASAPYMQSVRPQSAISAVSAKSPYSKPVAPPPRRNTSPKRPHSAAGRILSPQSPPTAAAPAVHRRSLADISAEIRETADSSREILRIREYRRKQAIKAAEPPAAEQGGLLSVSFAASPSGKPPLARSSADKPLLQRRQSFVTATPLLPQSLQPSVGVPSFEEQERAAKQRARDMAHQAVREREWACMRALEEANELCIMLQLNRQFKALRAPNGELRIRIYENGTTMIREVAPERLHREVRRLRSIVVQRRAIKPPQQPALVERQTADEERRVIREEQRTVMLDTLRLAGKLREQLRDLQRRGGRFSPFV